MYIFNNILTMGTGEKAYITTSSIEATDWEIFEEEKRVKCIYCKKPIHIDKFAGVKKEGMFCNGIFCLIALAKEQKESEEKEWNLADNTGYTHGEEVALISNIKTFIQKVKEKNYVFERGASFMDGANAVLEEIDKKAGDLK